MEEPIDAHPWKTCIQNEVTSGRFRKWIFRRCWFIMNFKKYVKVHQSSYFWESNFTVTWRWFSDFSALAIQNSSPTTTPHCGLSSVVTISVHVEVKCILRFHVTYFMFLIFLFCQRLLVFKKRCQSYVQILKTSTKSTFVLCLSISKFLFNFFLHL